MAVALIDSVNSCRFQPEVSSGGIRMALSIGVKELLNESIEN